MIKSQIYFELLIVGFFLFIGCNELNSPDRYMMIPDKIQIERVEYDENYNYYIYLSWGNYNSPNTGFKLTRDNEMIANLSKNEYSYIDTVQNTRTYEYRLFAIKGTIFSVPSYIKIRINYNTYDWWYD